MEELRKVHGSPGHLKVVDQYGSGAYLGFYDREKYKYVAQEMLVKAGVDIYFHAFISDVEKIGDKVTGLTAITKAGSKRFGAKIVIDASGDGDVAVMAGADYVYGDPETGKAQPGSAMFEMVDVDTDKVYDYIYENPEDFEWKSDIVPIREYSDRLKQHYFVAQGFKKISEKSRRSRRS